MRSGKWYSLQTVLLSAVIAGFAGSGCNRYGPDGINEQVVRTPYSLYCGDRQGSLYNTNDGRAFKLIFPIDGFPSRSLLTSGANILMVKRNLSLSADNGRNFNGNASLDVVIRTGWPSFMINGYNKTFIATETGIKESTDNGLTWLASEGGLFGKYHSFARLAKGNIFAVDSAGSILRKDGGPNAWTAVAINAPFPPGVYHLANFKDALVAGDASGANGVWFSNNDGVDWAQYGGLPTNQEIRSLHSPFGQGMLAGLDSTGIYRLVGSTFEPSNSGLTPFTSVYAITSKQDIYKNEIIRQYVYIATSTGLYRSEDLGQNWALMRGGDFRSVY